MMHEQIIQRFGADVETLFKVEGPFQSAGQGLLGVLLRSKDDLIHCHICGKWVKMLGNHSFKSHDMRSIEYRYKFGLPLDFPLCSRSVSGKRSQSAMDPDRLAKAIENLKKARLKGKKLSIKMKKSMKYAKNNAAHQNKHAGCEEQMLKRYHVVADIVGKNPSGRDLMKHDNSLRLMIGRSKHKNLNGFRKFHNLPTVVKFASDSDEAMIGHVRQFYEQHHRAPRPSDFGGKAKAMRRRFGSWHRLLMMSGMQTVREFSSAERMFMRQG